MKVTLYTSPNCVHCAYAKKFLDKHKVDYIHKNVADDAKAGKEMAEKTGRMGVPVLEVDGEMFLGFDRKVFKNMLNL